MTEGQNWDLYRSFLAVLKHGSLSAAARILGTSQPTIGRHIEALEAEFGATLFLRNRDGLLPTETALAMRKDVEAMAASSAALFRIAKGSLETVRGTVRISASELISIEFLPPMLRPLLEAYPQLDIELSPSDDLEDIAHRQADIAIRLVAPQQENLLSQKAGSGDWGFFAHKSYLAKHQAPETLADLSQHRLIGFDKPPPYVRAFISRFPKLAALHFSIRVDNYLAQLAAVRHGLGIGICQRQLCLRDHDLQAILPGIGNFTFDAYVVMHENLKTTPRCRLVFDTLVKGLRAALREEQSPHAVP